MQVVAQHPQRASPQFLSITINQRGIDMYGPTFDFPYHRVEADTVIILYVMRSERLLRSYLVDQRAEDT